MNTKRLAVLSALAVLAVAGTLLASAHVATLEQAGTKPKIQTSEGIVEFGEVTLNLAFTNQPRFLRTSMVFTVKEGDELKLANAIESQKPKMMHALISLASETQASEVFGQEKLPKLSGKLKSDFNTVLSKNGHQPYIEDVLFQSLMVQ